MSQTESDSESLESSDVAEQQELPDDVLEALGSGRLTDIRYLGSGATSSVFSGHDNRLDKRIAIKYLKHADANRLISFQTEAKLASKLNHDNLVRILNFGVTKQNHAFLIMEFVDGKSLEKILEENFRVPRETAVTLLMQVCAGLAHSHNKKIAHRDLKTANILIQDYGTERMRAIIVDFGLAQQRESQGQTTGKNSGKIKGSPLFISPEQAQGKPGDERSDIYSLGCVAFYMLTGSLPFEADDLFDLLRMHIETPAPSIAEMAPDADFPPALTRCIARMLEKNPSDRFQTIQEVQEHLAKSANRPISDSASPVVQKKLRTGSLLLFLGVPAICGFLVWFMLGRIRPDPTPGRTKPAYNFEEMVDEKFKRLFRYDTSTFLSHYNYKQICPVDTNQITDENLECLTHVPLTTPDINLSFTKITGSGLASLKSIQGLKLDLSKTALTGQGFEAIGSLKNLQALSLIGTKIRRSNSDSNQDENLRPISEMEISEVAQAGHIVELNLDTCKDVDDSCLVAIADLPLQGFTARDAGDITDVGVSALEKCKELRLLHLDSAKMTDKSLDAITALGTLQDFRANRCRSVTGLSLRRLSERNPKLKYVGFSFTKTTARDLHCLEGKDLEFLEIYGIPVGPAELKMIGNMPSMKNLYLSDVEDPDSLKYLYRLKNPARLIFLNSKNLTSKSILELHNRFPRCLVSNGKDNSISPELSEVGSMFIEGSSDENKFEGSQVKPPNGEISLP